MRIEQVFDLAYGVFDAQDPPDSIAAMEKSPDVQFLKVRNPSAEQTEKLEVRGFLPKPQWVEYILSFSHERIDSPAAFVARLPQQRRRQARQTIARAEELLANSQFNLVIDATQNLDDLGAFVALHTRVMTAKSRGRCVLKDRLEALGSLQLLSQQLPIAIYLKERQDMRAGLLAYDLPEGYSIGFCVSDESIRLLLGNAQLFLLLKLLDLSFRNSKSSILYGTDTNLYGHHLSVGLLRYKLGLLFSPRPKGDRELVKYIDASAAHLPLAFFQFEKGRARLVALVAKPREMGPLVTVSAKVDVREVVVGA